MITFVVWFATGWAPQNLQKRSKTWRVVGLQPDIDWNRGIEILHAWHNRLMVFPYWATVSRYGQLKTITLMKFTGKKRILLWNPGGTPRWSLCQWQTPIQFFAAGIKWAGDDLVSLVPHWCYFNFTIFFLRFTSCALHGQPLCLPDHSQNRQTHQYQHRWNTSTGKI